MPQFTLKIKYPGSSVEHEYVLPASSSQAALETVRSRYPGAIVWIDSAREETLNET